VLSAVTTSSVVCGYMDSIRIWLVLNRMCRKRLDSFGLGLGPVVVCCEHNNEC
jgi:hypothetical protein